MAENSNGSAGKSGSESGDRDSRWPPLESGTSSGSPNSAEGKPQQVNNDGATGCRPKNRQSWNSFEMQITVRGRGENRRNNIPPRMKNQKFRPSGQNFNHFQNFTNRPALATRSPIDPQAAPPIPPPIPPPMVPCVPNTLPMMYNPQDPSQLCVFNSCNVLCQNYSCEGASSSNGYPAPFHPPPPSTPSSPVYSPIRVLEFKDKEDYYRNQIIKQVEYFFKPSRVLGDSHLMNNMDPYGFVPISVIALFPEVRQLANTEDVIEDALQYSAELEVHCGKVRSRLMANNWAMPNAGAIHQVNPVTVNPVFQAFNLVAVTPRMLYPPSSGTVYYTPEGYAYNYVPAFQNHVNFPFGSNGVNNAPVFYPPSTAAHPIQNGPPGHVAILPGNPAPAINFGPDPDPVTMQHLNGNPEKDDSKPNLEEKKE